MRARWPYGDEEAGVLFTDDAATQQRGQVVLGPFDHDRPTARQSFRKFADITVDTVCFRHGQPLAGNETNKLKAAAEADEVEIKIWIFPNGP